MDDAQRKEIEELIRGMKCPKDFICYTSGLDVLCKAKAVGSDLMECLEESAEACSFSVVSDDKHFCRCPVRLWIATILGK